MGPMRLKLGHSIAEALTKGMNHDEEYKLFTEEVNQRSREFRERAKELMARHEAESKIWREEREMRLQERKVNESPWFEALKNGRFEP